MTDAAHCDICVIGGGSGGLTVAVGAALLGVPVVLIEPDPLGRDGAEALATAALLAVATQIQTARGASGLMPGLLAEPMPAIDLARIQRHVAATVEAASAANRVERLQGLGIRLVKGNARFLGTDRIATDGSLPILTARRFVIATVGAPLIPLIPGLGEVPFLTRTSLATLDQLPAHLAIIGGSAAALELAQTYRRLGSAVTLIAEGDLLGEHDPELVDLLLMRLRAEGVRVLHRTPIGQIAQTADGIRLTIGAAPPIVASHVLIATGRGDDVDRLNLAAAGIARGPAGIRVDRRLRTDNRRIYALGPSIGPYDAISDATAQAGLVLRQILFRQRVRFDPTALPRAVQSEPGLAQVGETERQARTRTAALAILRFPLHDNDRARVEGMAHGLVKVVTRRDGRILGAGIVGPNAGDLIQTWQLAIAQGLKVGAVAGLIPPYPTLGEASKRAAGTFFAPRLLSQRTRKLVRWLAMLG